MDAGRHPGRRRVRAVDGEVRQPERAQHDRPRHHERENRLAPRLAQPPHEHSHGAGVHGALGANSVRFIGS